jgi:putative transposase
VGSEDPPELPRKTRKSIEAPFHAHEFTFSTLQKRDVLLRPGIPEIVLGALSEARDKFDFEINAFVIMPDHVHVLIRPRLESYSIGPILQAIKGRASRRAFQEGLELSKLMEIRFTRNVVTRRLWEPGGGYDRNIILAKAAWAAIRYIHMNPVRKGLCGELSDWPWSSAPAYDGGVSPIPVDVCDWHNN